MGRVVKLILYYFGYQLGFSFIAAAGFCVGQFIKNGTIEIAQGMPLSLTLGVALISTLAMARHLVHYNYVKLNRESLSPVSGKAALIYIPLGIAAMVWMNWINDIAQLPNWFDNLFLQMKDNVFGIISVCIAAPIFEEMLFRGAIEGHLLRKWKNPRWAILVSALIFGLIHGNPAQILFAFLLGLVLGELYYRTGSLLPCIILHFINNTVSTILMNIYPSEDTMTDLMGANETQIVGIIGFGVFCILMYVFRKEFKAVSWKQPQPIEAINEKSE